MTSPLLWQSFVSGPLFSALNSCQSTFSARSRQGVSLAGSIVVLGYWRSGTTLLHTYLAHDTRFGFPTTYACMHPHHFLLTQAAALKGRQNPVRRPMDNVQVSISSPQEDEFGLLALGARSPYEALLAPCHLADALALSDPRDLSALEESRWRHAFKEFLSGVSVVEGRRPLILKSPPHGYRVATLRQLIPDARFVLIVRSPETVFESTIRMWRSLFQLYAIGAVPPEDHTRRVVIEDRPRFEAKLTEGLTGLPAERFALVRYEELVRDPLNVIGSIYEKLRLENFAEVEQKIHAERDQGARYEAQNAAPPDYWKQQVRRNWRPIFEKYDYA
jgi:hypothetical protein